MKLHVQRPKPKINCYKDQNEIFRVEFHNNMLKHDINRHLVQTFFKYVFEDSK